MDLYELGSAVFGTRRAEGESVLTDATTRTYVGTAVSDSEGGSVYVALSEDVTLPDDDDGSHGVGVEMPTTVAVEEGDDVIVTVYGGSTLKSPVVTGASAGGDRMREAVESARTVADAAQAVAEATGQHFWEADDGAHVTQVTREEWEGDGDGHESGPNSLWNSLGMLFRDGLDNLLALVTGESPGVAVYDGGGNDASNVVASFTGDGVTLGRSDSASLDIGADHIHMVNEERLGVLDVGPSSDAGVTVVNGETYRHIGDFGRPSSRYPVTFDVERAALDAGEITLSIVGSSLY